MQGRDYVDYFAYGSNMSEEDLSKWCKRHGYPPIKPLEVEVAVLRDFKLVFNYKSESRGCGVANIIPHKGGEVWGLLMRLSPSDYEKIKEKEGCCRVYKEIEVTVVTRSEGRAVKAKTFMVSEELQRREHVPPSRYYLNLLIEAARRYSFPRYYIEMLENTPVED